KPAARGASGSGKRPPARKGSPQLIISRQQAEGEAAAPEAPHAEEPPMAAAAAPVAEPAIVPVLSPEAPVVRKTRFGLPRRFQQAAAAPAAPPVAEAPAAVSAPVVEEPATPEPEVVAEPEPVVTEATRRYRFDRTRAGVSVAAAPRPERLSVTPGELYTTPARGEPSEPETPLDLPSLEELTERVRAAEPERALPELPVVEPAVSESEPSAGDESAEPEAAEATPVGEEGEAAEEEPGIAGGRRRRRRRRGSALRNGAHTEDAEADTEATEGSAEESYDVGRPYSADQEAPETLGQDVYVEPEPESERPAGRGRFSRGVYGGRPERQTPAEPGWGAEPARPAAMAEPTPYSGPEPSFARGFGPAPRGVATPLREAYPRPGRVERGLERATPDTASTAQLGLIIRDAINAQTDRLLNELRRQQTPPALTFSLPAMPSSERVGVFVDVANLFYSARALRVNIDFGQLLDFLRGNRRLARAHAYAPTNPEPGADQAFLSAVKGLGYRITTKNYKTFSSGAKKADLDLDLCMDIVRLVDAKALDTVVLVSGDSDFLPLLDYCGDHGVRVEVAAFDDSASMILRQSCDLFINLSLVEAIRG
ncbi:MAG TPA: NYN domain-containing protein, partial [Ktedonobacterales bacterium]